MKLNIILDISPANSETINRNGGDSAKNILIKRPDRLSEAINIANCEESVFIKGKNLFRRCLILCPP
ncbi:hypothetical protein L2D01_07460 [Hyphomonadaceae bacterium ML37]|nr:hypothetical protein L2D01_07460 [Hyphomonadaceae bacterium ML37]